MSKKPVTKTGACSLCHQVTGIKYHYDICEPCHSGEDLPVKRQLFSRIDGDTSGEELDSDLELLEDPTDSKENMEEEEWFEDALQKAKELAAEQPVKPKSLPTVKLPQLSVPKEGLIKPGAKSLQSQIQSQGLLGVATSPQSTTPVRSSKPASSRVTSAK